MFELPRFYRDGHKVNYLSETIESEEVNPVINTRYEWTTFCSGEGRNELEPGTQAIIYATVDDIPTIMTVEPTDNPFGSMIAVYQILQPDYA